MLNATVDTPKVPALNGKMVDLFQNKNIAALHLSLDGEMKCLQAKGLEWQAEVITDEEEEKL